MKGQIAKAEIRKFIFSIMELRVRTPVGGGAALTSQGRVFIRTPDEPIGGGETRCRRRRRRRRRLVRTARRGSGVDGKVMSRACSADADCGCFGVRIGVFTYAAVTATETKSSLKDRELSKRAFPQAELKRSDRSRTQPLDLTALAFRLRFGTTRENSVGKREKTPFEGGGETPPSLSSLRV